MDADVKTLSQIWADDRPLNSNCVDGPWKVKAIVSDDCLSYVAWNELNKEALIVDPKLEALEACRKTFQELKNFLCLAVIDTHTHADHVSAASQLAKELDAPLIMHHLSPSTKVGLRVGQRTVLASHSAKLELLCTPGHTPDGITAIWGPFAFTGDTVFYADVGRDDLPGGDPAAHFESLKTLCAVLSPETILLPGHDFKGGRSSSWETQLKINSSLIQGRDEFIVEAAAFDAPAPKAFKKSLFENFK